MLCGAESGAKGGHMIIVRTTESVVPGIVGIAAATAEGSSSARQKEEFGFLRPYTTAQYMEFARLADHFYVAVEDGKVSAFLLAHTSTKIDLKEEIYAYIQSTQREPFIVVRQIAVLPPFCRKGIGEALYVHLSEQAAVAPIKCKAAIASIWKEPSHNLPSERFHSTMGYQEIGTYTLRGGHGVVGIWKKLLVGISIPEPLAA